MRPVRADRHRAVDREPAQRVEAANPAKMHAARSNRAFLGRAVEWCTARGVDRFLDLGSGMPGPDVPAVGGYGAVATVPSP